MYYAIKMRYAEKGSKEEATRHMHSHTYQQQKEKTQIESESPQSSTIKTKNTERKQKTFKHIENTLSLHGWLPG